MEKKRLHKLISQTFDSDPEVRKRAAMELADVDDPGATFALIELTYDKDLSVSELAKKILEEKGKKEPKLLTLTELFDLEKYKKKEEVSEEKDVIENKILEPIERIFEKTLGKEKAKKFKDRFMPQILKRGRERRKEVVQEVLLAYLDELGEEKEEIEEVSSIEINEEKMRREIEEAMDEKYFTVEYQGEKINLDKSIKPVFQIALELFLETDDEKVIKREKELIKKYFIKQIELAFRIARDKTKKRKVVNLTEIKDRMRRIYTEPLEVLSVEKINLKISKRKTEVITRLRVKDQEGNEGVVYVFEGRGEKIKPGFRIRIEEGKAKYFSFSGETAIVVNKKSKIVAEF